MFSVTPVPENKERRVSFSPDIDQSYRHHVVDKIRNLMDEVQVHESCQYRLCRKRKTIQIYAKSKAKQMQIRRDNDNESNGKRK